MSPAAEQCRTLRPYAEDRAYLSPQVWLLDPFCFTPWYSAALACSLKEAGAAVRFFSAPLLREPTYHESLGLRPESGPFRVPDTLRAGPAPIGRAVRLIEALLNVRILSHSLQKKSSRRPDILHFQQMPMLNHGLRADFRLIDAARQAGIPVVHTVHNLLPHDTADRLRTVYAELYGRMDHLICHSSCTVKRLRDEFQISEQRMSVIPHGPLFATMEAPSAVATHAARARLKLPSNQPIVLWQGVLAPYKGLDVLLQAWKQTIEFLKKTTGLSPLLLIAGSGPREFQRDIRQAVLNAQGTVRADLEYIPTNRVSSYYTAADILVYPYRTITTSGALLTGLTYAKPIIASRLLPFEEYLVDGENARLVPPEDPAALSNALSSLLLDLATDRRTDVLSAYARLAVGATHNRSRYIGWPEIGSRTFALYRALTASISRPAQQEYATTCTQD